MIRQHEFFFHTALVRRPHLFPLSADGIEVEQALAFMAVAITPVLDDRAAGEYLFNAIGALLLTRWRHHLPLAHPEIKPLVLPGVTRFLTGPCRSRVAKQCDRQPTKRHGFFFSNGAGLRI